MHGRHTRGHRVGQGSSTITILQRKPYVVVIIVVLDTFCADMDSIGRSLD